MLSYQLLFFVVFLGIVASFDYDPKVEEMILGQMKHWNARRHQKGNHRIALHQKDIDYFDKMAASSCSKKKNERSKRSVLGRRTEYRCMPLSQRTAYHKALNDMKSTMVGFLSEYDNFVVKHDPNVAASAHFGPSFTAWHREYLNTLETALHTHCPTCMIPYWDSRLDKRLAGNNVYSAMFSPTTFGNTLGTVTTGFAANWTAPSPACADISPTLYRNLSASSSGFYDDRDVSFVDTVARHEDISYPWTTQFEFSHGYVHNSFGYGSHMSDMMCSPFDPIFVSHHCFIDYLFERARISLQNVSNLVYANTSNLPPSYDDSTGHIAIDCAASAPMSPFPNLVNSDGLTRTDYTSLFYDYEKTPGDVFCSVDTDCCGNGSKELVWCNTATNKCVGKVQEFGRMNRSFPVRACYCSGGRTPYLQLYSTYGLCRCR